MSPPSAVRREIDPKIWRACAGASVQIPSLFSRVYYFPQGHVEHCCPSSTFISSPVASPIPCIVSSINLLADPVTDEVFAHLSLHPVAPDHFPPHPPTRFDEDESESDKVVTFAKVLTASDANNGGGFSVPRYCADSVFPPLDFQADPPVQKLFITDVNGVVWDFRHIYRGTPRRHLLTTGWSKFVNSKKLICGDSVVFMRKSVHELFIGVRRAPSSNKSGGGGGGGGSYYGGGGGTGDEYFAGYPYGGVKKEDGGEKKWFRRDGNGKLTVEAVTEAIGKASQGLPFEVVYYPTAGWSDFVVRAEDVEASVSVYWAPGTRVKMAMETEDSSRITWFQGVVSASFQETWKQLQITWDEPEILQNLKRVNPWQVEVVASSSTTQQLHATYLPPTKRSKYPPHGSSSSGFMSGGGEEGEMIYYGRGGQAMVDPSPYGYTTYTTVPAGMQGARHFEFGSYNNSTGFIGENAHPEFINFFSPLPGLGRVSTAQMVNFGSPQPSDDLSPNSNTTNVSSGNDAGGNNRGISFQLFGKVINVQEPAESGVAESSLCEEDGSKESSDNEVPNEAQLLGHGGR
ncbi:Auxin response factor 17 [Hirschfeldia incana]|nr:Auxin response factor 17 [Hirschfeldia incana]KAJ0241480.1 Auxin response factor 17 [Hirschfeldia incana]